MQPVEWCVRRRADAGRVRRSGLRAARDQCVRGQYAREGEQRGRLTHPDAERTRFQPEEHRVKHMLVAGLHLVIDGERGRNLGTL